MPAEDLGGLNLEFEPATRVTRAQDINVVVERSRFQ